MTLRDLNQPINEANGRITMTDMEICYKVLIGDSKFKKFLSDTFKPKLEGATVNYKMAFLKRPLNTIKKSIIHFIDKVIGKHTFKRKYSSTLEPLKINPLAW